MSERHKAKILRTCVCLSVCPFVYPTMYALARYSCIKIPVRITLYGFTHQRVSSALTDCRYQHCYTNSIFSKVYSLYYLRSNNVLPTVYPHYRCLHPGKKIVTLDRFYATNVNRKPFLCRVNTPSMYYTHTVTC